MEKTKIRPSRIQIDMDALVHNIKEITANIDKDTLITAVVKANAYGHGAIACSKLFLENGADRLAVSTVEEGIELRKANIKAPILLLNYIPEEQYEEVFKYDLIPNIYDLESAIKINAMAEELNKTIKIHINIDTGVRRLGFPIDDQIIENILDIKDMGNIEIEGIFSHFAKADEEEEDFSHRQYNDFIDLVERLEEKDIYIPIRHICNTAGTIRFPDYHLDMVRIGIGLYGYYPSKELEDYNIRLKPALELRTKISYIKEVKKNTGISYNHKFITDRDTKIGTLPIGYADGYNKLLSNNGISIIDGKEYKNIGSICMDQFMIDLGNNKDIEKGDDVLLISGAYKNISVESISDSCNTINYDILCMLGRRLPRVYLMDKKIIEIKDYLL